MSPRDYEDNPPPTYDSLFGKIKHAKQESDGNAAFVTSVIAIASNTVGYLIFLVVMLAVPISCLVMGAMFLHQCPVQKYIPIYLLVAGVFGIIKNLFSIIQSMRARKNAGHGDQQQQERPNPLDAIISCFLFAWFICGNVWIYGTYNNFTTNSTIANNFTTTSTAANNFTITDTLPSDYCHPTLYYFAFWLLNALYILGGLACVFGCAFCIFACCCMLKAN